jgi:hypothetical protein
MGKNKVINTTIDKNEIRAGDTIEWSFKQANKSLYSHEIGIVKSDTQGELSVKTPDSIVWLLLESAGLTVSKIISREVEQG